MISGFGPTAGAALCSHMDVNKVTGMHLMLVNLNVHFRILSTNGIWLSTNCMKKILNSIGT